MIRISSLRANTEMRTAVAMMIPATAAVPFWSADEVGARCARLAREHRGTGHLVESAID